MTKNLIIPKENFPKIEEIREINTEIPSYKEFLETYQNDKLLESSYRDEYEAKVAQGSQYGPGKSDFSGLCSRIKNNLGSDLVCKISCNSDPFYSWKDYVGVIAYAVNGRFEWDISDGRGCSHRRGHRGRSFYVIVRNTDNLGSDGIGVGGFFRTIIKDEFGIDLNYNNNVICCGGFGWKDGILRFNSYALNSADQIGCNSDGSSELSFYEKRLTEYCFNEYKTKGSGSTIYIPSYYLP